MTHHPTHELREQVKILAAVGTRQDLIAMVLGITPNTLRKHYREVLDTAEVLANAKVGQSLFQKATGNGPAAVTAAIFWMKCRAGWKDRTVVEHDGGVSIESKHYDGLSDRELRLVQRIAAKAAATATNRLPDDVAAN